jgi:UDP-N-acetylglucosamine--N-acetylmuramyl-(pentapeptide) pyrophosphoryl-undecaprenol N-acetylglucosamine transferase
VTDLKRAIFTGGGTGGHLFPGLAVVEELRDRFPDFTPWFVGSERGIEKRILKEAGLRHQSLPIRSSSDLRRAPISFLRSYWQSKQLAAKTLEKFRPEVVIGLGGFASVPVVRAAQAMRIPTLLLEQNTVLGRANKWLMNRADKVCHSFEESVPTGANLQKHIVTGNPVRKVIQELVSRERQSSTVQTILILGGSQGAQAVNRIWLSVVQELGAELDSLQIIHQTGESDCEMVREEYRQRGFSSITEPFFEVLPTLYRQADLVISRAGATTLAEVACAGIPAILIPYHNSVGDHQQKNAELFATSGAAKIVIQTAENEESSELTVIISKLLNQPLTDMQQAIRTLAKPDAAKHVVDLVTEIIGSLQEN